MSCTACVCDQVERTDGLWRSAEYSTFSIGDEARKYRLAVAGYRGEAGDAMAAATLHSGWIANGRKFTTRDRDNDGWSAENCASRYGGGWWFAHCSASFLNRNPAAYWSDVSPHTDIRESHMLVKLN